jgi:hypothetical protein
MEVLGHPLVLMVAGVLFLLEFFADKVPWVDSLWDSVHTVIRPLSGALLAMQALGDLAPHWEVIGALLGGVAALTVHGAKAGSRLLINHSPEPFTNMAMSFSENVGVAGGLALVIWNPLLAFFVFVGILILLWLLLPRVLRVIRATLWLVWKKLRMPGKKETGGEPVILKAELDADVLGLLMGRGDTIEREVAWTCECLTGKCKGVRGLRLHQRVLVVARKSGQVLLLVVRGTFKDQLVAMPLEGAEVSSEVGLLSDQIVVQTPSRLLTLRFPRDSRGLVDTVCQRLREMVQMDPTSAPETDLPALNAPAEEAQETPLAPLPSL